MPQPPPEDRAQSLAFGQIARELAGSGLTFRFRAIGQSMYPTIRNGEMVHVAPVGAHKLRSGDIVLFREGRKFKAHRIIKVFDPMCVTRGDASLQTDGEIDRPQIIGRVIAKECLQSGRLISLAGPVARGRFRALRIRARLVRLLHWRTPSNSAPCCSRQTDPI